MPNGEPCRTLASRCKRYILNAAPMLRTCTCRAAAAEAVVQMRKPHSECNTEPCTHAAHRRAQKIHPEGCVSVDVRAVLPQSRPCRVVDQPTCGTVNDSSSLALSARNRGYLRLLASIALCAKLLLSKFSTLLPLRRAREAESVQRGSETKQLAVDSCPTAEVERILGAQNSPVCCRVQQTSPA
jgi:hypothetical protein